MCGLRRVRQPAFRSRLGRAFLPAALALLAACSDRTEPAAGPAQCTPAEHRQWIAKNLRAWYLWADRAPHPDPVDPSTPADPAVFFKDSLFHGQGPDAPADRWSYRQPEAAWDRLFDDGQALGWGIDVAGLETAANPALPLLVRRVEPLSPAAAQGVARGDELVSVAGRSARELIAADDFDALKATRAGQRLSLVVRRAGVDRELTLDAAVYALSPVGAPAILTSPGGHRIGYLAVQAMIDAARPPMDAAFAAFRAAGVDDLVLDLRYNGGGLVEIGRWLASQIAGPRAVGMTYADLRFNARRARLNDRTVDFVPTPSALGLARVFVLTGRRTCSASEQLINGLRGVGVEVVTIGQASCGKPVGFIPVSACGLRYSSVNFESLNARGEGRYYAGFAPTCPVTEDLHVEAGQRGDPLLAAALSVVEHGRCPPPP